MKSPLGSLRKKLPRLLLVQPGFPWQINKPTRLPLGLMSLASILRARFPGIEVCIIDMPAQNLNLDQLLNEIERTRPDIVGVSLVSVFFGIGRELATQLKQRYPHILNIAGGPHPSALPEYTLSHSDFDIAIAGPGERALCELVLNWSLGKGFEDVAGVYFKRGGQVCRSEQCPDQPEYSFTSLPAAANSLNLLNLEDYDNTLEGELVYPTMATRGCPHNCAFCGGGTVFSNFEKRPVEAVVDELEYIYTRYGIEFIHFLDDTLTADRQYAVRLFTEIMNRSLPIKWMGMTRADAIVRSKDHAEGYKEARRMLELAKQSGCVGFALGVESGDARVLALIDKGLNLDNLREAARLFKYVGLPLKYFFIVGLPGQDEQSIQKTIDIIKRDRPDSINVTIAKPLPGSQLFQLWLAIQRENASRGSNGSLPQSVVIELWQEIKKQGKNHVGHFDERIAKYLDSLWELLMFEEEPGLKGSFTKERLSPLFQTTEVPLEKTLALRREVLHAYAELRKEIRLVPVFRRPFGKQKRQRILRDIDRLLVSEQLEMGHYTQQFENAFSKTVGTTFALAVSNGTAGLDLALRARFGSLEGRSVVVPANANIADVSCVIRAGGNVILGDVTKDSLSLDPENLEALLAQESSRLNISAIILVHMGGFISPDIYRIKECAKNRGIFLLEDASHAHGASFEGTSAGRFGEAAVFSLFSTKLLTSLNGGIVVTDNSDLYGKLYSQREMGRILESRDELYDTQGGNYRMDEMQAIVASADLEDLAQRIERRREIAEFYDRYFAEIAGLRSIKVPKCLPSYYKYLLIVDPQVHPEFSYSKVRFAYATHGVDLPGLVYGYTLDNQKYPKNKLYIPGTGIEVAKSLSKYQIALPIYASMTNEQVSITAEILASFFGSALHENRIVKEDIRLQETIDFQAQDPEHRLIY